tara:strand:+ start:255 stop:392 length:138 start_codon:yes stop_codon:yes gene_type:complete
MTNESVPQSKRKSFKNFYRENINKEIPIALAEGKDKFKYLHEIKE